MSIDKYYDIVYYVIVMLKITYFKQNRIDIKRTAISYGKYYISNYVTSLREDKIKDS